MVKNQSSKVYFLKTKYKRLNINISLRNRKKPKIKIDLREKDRKIMYDLIDYQYVAIFENKNFKNSFYDALNQFYVRLHI